MFSYFDLLVQLVDLLKVILGTLFAAIDGFHSDVIRLQKSRKRDFTNSYSPRSDFAQKAKSRGGTLVTRAYIKESTYS